MLNHAGATYTFHAYSIRETTGLRLLLGSLSSIYA